MLVAHVGSKRRPHCSWSYGATTRYGTALNPAQAAVIGGMVNDIAAHIPGFDIAMSDWQDSGGDIGLLTGGLAKGIVKACADGDTILLEAGGTPAQMRTRLMHELIHAVKGGSLTPCEHASAWAHTYSLLSAFCNEGFPSSCASFKNAREKVIGFSAGCNSPIPPPPAQNPACCTN